MEAQRKLSTEEKTNRNSSVTTTNSSKIESESYITETATFEDLWVSLTHTHSYIQLLYHSYVTHYH